MLLSNNDIDMASYRHFKKYNNYRHYYNDYGEENPLVGLIIIGLFYLIYTYYTDKITFWHWIFYGIVIIVFLLLILVLIKIWKKKRNIKTDTEIKNVNADIKQLVESVENEDVAKTSNSPTPQAQALHDALVARGIKCKLEQWDGHKHIDIAIPWARMNIEIDGTQHYLDPKQVVSDYQRSYYSMIKGFKTIRYPNFVIEKYLDSVADGIAKIARKEYYK